MFFWCPCMAIYVNVQQYNDGLLPDIILLTQCYLHRGICLNAMKRFCICSLWSHLNVLTFFPHNRGMLRRSRCVLIFSLNKLSQTKSVFSLVFGCNSALQETRFHWVSISGWIKKTKPNPSWLFSKHPNIYLSGFLFVSRTLNSRPLSIRRAFLLAYLGINSMWKSISEKRQCSAKKRHNAQHNKHKSIRCATKRIKGTPRQVLSLWYMILVQNITHETLIMHYTAVQRPVGTFNMSTSYQ